MRAKPRLLQQRDPEPHPSASGTSRRRGCTRRIQADLEGRGVPAGFSSRVSERLEPFFEDLSAEAYDAVLSGVALAYGVQRRDRGRLQEAQRGVAEIEQLMGGFVDELKKLDEALEALAAYVARMRRPSGAVEEPEPEVEPDVEPEPTLH